MVYCYILKYFIFKYKYYYIYPMNIPNPLIHKGLSYGVKILKTRFCGVKVAFCGVKMVFYGVKISVF